MSRCRDVCHVATLFSYVKVSEHKTHQTYFDRIISQSNIYLQGEKKKTPLQCSVVSYIPLYWMSKYLCMMLAALLVDHLSQISYDAHSESQNKCSCLLCCIR